MNTNIQNQRPIPTKAAPSKISFPKSATLTPNVQRKAPFPIPYSKASHSSGLTTKTISNNNYSAKSNLKYQTNQSGKILSTPFRIVGDGSGTSSSGGKSLKVPDKSELTKSNFVKTAMPLNAGTHSISNANFHSETKKKEEPPTFDIVEKLMRKHEAMVKQVMKQKDHLAKNFTSKSRKNKLRYRKPNNLESKKIPNTFEAAKKAYKESKIKNTENENGGVGGSLLNSLQNLQIVNSNVYFPVVNLNDLKNTDLSKLNNLQNIYTEPKQSAKSSPSGNLKVKNSKKETAKYQVGANNTKKLKKLSKASPTNAIRTNQATKMSTYKARSKLAYSGPQDKKQSEGSNKYEKISSQVNLSVAKTPEKPIKNKIEAIKVSPDVKLNKMEQSLLEEDIKENSIYLGRRVDHSSSKKSGRFRFNSSNNNNTFEGKDNSKRHQGKPIESILGQLEMLSNMSANEGLMSVKAFEEDIDNVSHHDGSSIQKSTLRNKLANK